MDMKTVFELKTLAKKRGLCGYSRLTKCELVQLLQREEEPMDIDLPSDWLKYDEYADSEFLVHFSDINDDEYWKHRLKFWCEQLNVYNGTFRQQFIKTFLNLISLLNVRQDVLNSVCNHVDGETRRAIDRELFNRYYLNNILFLRAFWVLVEYYYCNTQLVRSLQKELRE